jgi:hypothetical protein
MRVAVVDETLANRYWPTGAVGRRFWADAKPGNPNDAFTIVGVVTPVHQSSLRDSNLPGAMYAPVTQSSPGFVRLAVTHHGPEREWATVVERIQSVDAALTPFWTDTLANSVNASLLFQRGPMLLLGVFSAVGLFLGMLGIYGVLAHEFAARRREIAVRVAVGGTRGDIVALVWRRWSVIVGIGAIAGLGGTFAATRLVEGLLFGTGPTDPGVLVAALLAMAGAAALSAIAPTRRAIAVDPALTLRQD